MAIRIQVIDTSQGPADSREHRLELPDVPRVGEQIVFYTDNGGEHIVTVHSVFWLVNSAEEDVQLRAR